MNANVGTLVMSLATAMLLLASSGAGAEPAAGPAISWHDAKSLSVEGQGWSGTAAPYDRLPARAEAIVSEGAWAQSRSSAGIVVRFVTDAPEITVRWKLTSSALAMDHMPATGVSGVDLYVRRDGKWEWLAVGRVWAQENTFRLISGLTPEQGEYALYLPLYNGTASAEIGVPEGSAVKPGPPRKPGVRPVVFYGTSITQGGCASRPGMAYPAIIGRRLDIPTINLGFSGAGKCEREVADLLAELDPAVYVIDPLPNMAAEWIDGRIKYLLGILREKHPDASVVLVETAGTRSVYSREKLDQDPQNIALAKVYKDCRREWGKRLYYVKGGTLVGSDGEGTVDGVHPTDLGFQRMADILTPIVRRALDDHRKP